jgi:hypothetical protein
MFPPRPQNAEAGATWQAALPAPCYRLQAVAQTGLKNNYRFKTEC